MKRASTRPPEAERDQNESGFTPILRALWADHPGVLAVAFVDLEGECVDYCSSLPPFDAKIAGAQMRVLIEDVGARMQKVKGGSPKLMHVAASRREILARRVTDEYLLVVLVRPHRAVRKLIDAIESTAVKLRVEAGEPAPAWDRDDSSLDVEVRVARGWPYAPAAFMDGGQRIAVAAVLGRWVEGAEATGGELVCFRVRTEPGEEMTLAHDLVTDRWLRR